MTREARSYYAAACSHRELDGKWLGTFGLPGQEPAWVMRGKEKAVFDTAVEAEIAAYRMLMKRLNGALEVQDFRVRGDVVPMTRKTNDNRKNPKMPFSKKDIASDVFKNFK